MDAEAEWVAATAAWEQLERQLDTPVAAVLPRASVKRARESEGREGPRVCPGCSNCCFARSAGGVCTGGGHPPPPHKRLRDGSATPAHSFPGARRDNAPPGATTSTGGDTVAQEKDTLPWGTARESAVLGKDSAVADIVDLPQH